jgi:hypothetical protein
MSCWEDDKYPRVHRDNQRRKEYKSEWAVTKVFPEKKLSNDELAVYLRTVTHDQWFIDRFGKVTFSICFSNQRKTTASCKRRYKNGRDNPPTYSLHFPASGGNEKILALHEMCHVLCYDQSHGPIFCSVLLQIVLRYMGLAVGKELRRQFAIHGVDRVR